MNSLILLPSPGNRLTGPDQTGLSAEDRLALQRAVDDLDRQTWVSRLGAILRQRLGIIGVTVPARLATVVNTAAEGAIRAALAIALRSLDGKPVRDRRHFHKHLAALAGGAGGALGLSGLPIELPLTTAIILRSIADIARGEGEDLADPGTAFACLAVLGLGSTGGIRGSHTAGMESQTVLETGYFATRAVLARAVTDAGRYLTAREASLETAPVLARLVTRVADRFGMAASQKLAAQTIPLIGAATGAAINYAFVDHFQSVARGHFTIVRLERRYGAAAVHAEYQRILNSGPG